MPPDACIVQTAFVALGSNLREYGRPPAETLAKALHVLGATSGVHVVQCSQGYRTPAVPAGSGPDFVNAAARIETELAPGAVLARLHEIEDAMGRRRPARWTPRICDLDLIAWGTAICPDVATVRAWMDLPPELAACRTPDRLLLPHPRLHERAFVLVPLAEIAPGWRHPLTGQTAAAMRDARPAAERAAIEPIGPLGPCISDGDGP